MIVDSASASRSPSTPPLRLAVVPSTASPEEVAAIVAAISACIGATRASAVDDGLHEWVRAARLRAHRATLQRGPWRLSARIGRRPRT